MNINELNGQLVFTFIRYKNVRVCPKPGAIL